MQEEKMGPFPTILGVGALPFRNEKKGPNRYLYRRMRLTRPPTVSAFLRTPRITKEERLRLLRTKRRAFCIGTKKK